MSRSGKGIPGGGNSTSKTHTDPFQGAACYAFLLENKDKRARSYNKARESYEQIAQERGHASSKDS